MAAKAEDAPPIPPAASPIDSCTDPGPDPAPRGPRKAEEEEREYPPRESKRRRTCPAALETTPSPAAAAAAAAEKMEDEEEGRSSEAARGEAPSFSFDTRGFVTPVETTPKFGCFRFSVADPDPTTAAAAAETTTEMGGAEEEHDADENQIGNN